MTDSTETGGREEHPELPARSDSCLAYLLPFLPCVDDWAKLLVMSDVAEANGDTYMAKHLRWTSRSWQWGLGLPRASCFEGAIVWARYSSQGWSRAIIHRVTPLHITVSFPHRDLALMSGERQQAKRAWWDLEPRDKQAWSGLTSKSCKKPKPRKGYSTTNNATLAALLTGNSKRIAGLRDAAPCVERDGQQELPLFEGVSE